MKRAGLVLEGGANRGVFTSGALDYLMEQDFYIPYVVGTSAGACNAVDYVSRQPLRTKNCTIITDKKKRYITIKNTKARSSLSCTLFAYCYILVDIRTLSSFSLILKNLFAITSI